MLSSGSGNSGKNTTVAIKVFGCVVLLQKSIFFSYIALHAALRGFQFSSLAERIGVTTTVD